MEPWVISLLSVGLSAAYILVQSSIKRGQDLQRVAALEKKADKLEKEMAREDVTDVRLESLTTRLAQLEDRYERLDRKVSNGSGH